VYINPEILSSSTPGIVEESCLSVPGVVCNVLRATQLRVRARNPDGETFERDLEGMHAVCLQHEMDHLAGKTLVDRMSLIRRLRMRAAAARQQRAAKQAGGRSAAA
jgi:peptide deformylase